MKFGWLNALSMDKRSKWIVEFTDHDIEVEIIVRRLHG